MLFLLALPPSLAVCLIPMGVESPSVGPQIAEVQRVLAKSGIHYTLHGYGASRDGSDGGSLAREVPEG